MTTTLDAPQAPPRTKKEASTVTLTIARSALRTALTRLSGAVGSGVKALPVTHHVRLEVQPGSVTFTATDFETWARLTVPCEATGEAVVLLPAKRLSEIVANLPPVGAVTLVIDASRSVLTAGRSVFELSGLALDEWPRDMEVQRTARVIVQAAAFLDALARVVSHASTAESRPELNVIRIEPGPAALRLSAHDGPRLACLAVAAAGGPLASACSLHRGSVPAFARLFAGLPEGATLSLGAEDTRLLVEGEDATAIVRLVDRDFPDYSKALASLTPSRTVVCDRLLLRAAIQRVALAADETHRVEIDLGDEITVRASAEARAGTDVVRIEEQRGDIDPEAVERVTRTFALNAAYALAALDTLPTDSIAIEIDTSTRPIVFRPVGTPADDPTLVLVQPLRIL